MSDINEMKPAKKGPSTVVIVVLAIVVLAIANIAYRSTDNRWLGFGILIVGLVGLGLWGSSAKKSKG
jgi:hypothetical protein